MGFDVWLWLWVYGFAVGVEGGVLSLAVVDLGLSVWISYSSCRVMRVRKEVN